MLRDTLRTTPAMAAGATAGPAMIAAAGLTPDELLADSWDDLVVRYRKWATVAADDATTVIGGFIGEWRTGYPAAMKATWAGHLDESEAMLRAGLHGIAVDKFLDPKGLDEVGELVPNGFVRHVLARAGGTTDIAGTGYAYVSLRADGSPLPGLATGPMATDAIEDHGGKVQAFRWVYGPAWRTSPFRPHSRLDGVVFHNFDDPKLINGSGFPPFSHYMPGDHAGCRCDAEPIVITPDQAKALGITAPDPFAVLSPREARAAQRAADIAAAAEKFGVTPDEVRAALSDVAPMRRAIADDAAATQERAYAQLQRGGIEKALLPRPPRGARGGEWDWLQSLSQMEKDRLSRAWYSDATSLGLDEIAEALQAEVGGLGNKGISEIMEDVWLPLNRQIEAAGAVRRGKLPIAKHYSGSSVIDVNQLAPNVHAAGVDVQAIVGVSDVDAAGYLAQLERAQVGDEAFSVLGDATRARIGPAPYDMSFQAWEAEVRDLEFGLREFPDEISAAQRARYDELVPLLLDSGGLDYESLYSVIVQAANLAGLPVPAHARIPWAD